ncbi:MAG: hypothetical protein GXY83_23085 [Rhodopirellula sp.]|nr:hypothetical protein [Rhodopirellula sp.]
MEIERDRIYAVISGDVIGSSKLSPSKRAELPDIMKQASNELRTFLAGSIPLSVDIFSGDSWQLLVSEPGEALKAALFYRSSIIVATEKMIDTRLVIAVGKVDFVPGERASEGDGEAFRLSGRSLKEASKQQMRFVAEQCADCDLWDATFGLIDVVVRRWSAKQTQAVVGAFQGRSHAEIAAGFKPPIERESATRLLTNANWHAIEQVVKIFKSKFSATYG